MTHPMELVERLEKDVPINLDWPAAARLEIIKANVERSEAAACIRELVSELEDARASVRAFAAPWAVTFARERGYPDGALHFDHYDILAAAGARMNDFTRHTPPADRGGV